MSVLCSPHRHVFDGDLQGESLPHLDVGGALDAVRVRGGVVGGGDIALSRRQRTATWKWVRNLEEYVFPINNQLPPPHPGRNRRSRSAGGSRRWS